MNKSYEILSQHFKTQKDSPFLLNAHFDESLTWGESMDLSLRSTEWLIQNGVNENAKVGYLTNNGIETILISLAAIHLGAEIIPVNPLYDKSAIQIILQEGNLNFLIYQKSALNQSKIDLADFDNFKKIKLPDSVDRSWNRNEFLTEIADLKPVGSSLAAIRENKQFLTVFTSGTTGTPKGIPHRAQTLLNNGYTFGKFFNLGPQNRFYNILPITYLGGLYNLFLLPMVSGCSVVVDDVFGPSSIFRFWDTVCEKSINTLWFNSSLLAMLLQLRKDESEQKGSSQVKTAFVGMAPLPTSLKREFENRFGFKIYENYGLSETTFITTNHPSLEYKPGSVGEVLPGVRVEIEKADEKDEFGEIIVKSHYLTSGYCLSARQDQLAFTPEGFRTGDLGYLDNDGELFVTGRKKDIIIRGGLNISPKAIENCIHQIDQVHEVLVFGKPHPTYGEEVYAAVSLLSKISEKEILNHCKINISSAFAPKKIFILNQIPKGATGKPDKKALLQILEKGPDNN